jgi:hypothetical protein
LIADFGSQGQFTDPLPGDQSCGKPRHDDSSVVGNRGEPPRKRTLHRRRADPGNERPGFMGTKALQAVCFAWCVNQRLR